MLILLPQSGTPKSTDNVYAYWHTLAKKHKHTHTQTAHGHYKTHSPLAKI